MFLLLLLVTAVWDLHAQVQGHDMVILRNSKGRTVKSYFNGINLEGADKSGRGIYGVIRKIRADSIFVQTYDVRKQYNMWGTSVLDTVTSYLTPYHVNEVAWIRKPPAKFEFVRDGSLFMIGGSAYLLLHVINAAYLKQPVIGSTVAIAGGIAVTGFVMHKLRKRKYVIGRGYELKYVGME